MRCECGVEGICDPGPDTYPKIDRSEKSKTTGQFGNLTGNGLIFEKVTGQCPFEHVLRTHVGVVCRVDAGALLRVSCFKAVS